MPLPLIFPDLTSRPSRRRRALCEVEVGAANSFWRAHADACPTESRSLLAALEDTDFLPVCPDPLLRAGEPVLPDSPRDSTLRMRRGEGWSNSSACYRRRWM